MVRGMDKKKLLIVVLLVAVGVIFQILIQDIPNFFENKRDGILIDNIYSNDFILKEKQFKNLSEITIDNPAGNIFIESSKTEINYINATIVVFHKDKIEAEKTRNTISITFEEKSNKLMINSKFKGSFPLNRVRINYTLKLSDKSLLIVTNANGIINASKIKSSMKITNIKGRILLNEIEGKIFIKEAKDNDVIISDCSNIIANLVNTTTKISKTSGNIDLFAKGGKIRIESIDNTKSIKIDSRQSRVSLSNIKNKKINIKISYEDIFVKNVSTNNIDLFLKNSNLVIDPIASINRININALDAKIILKKNVNVLPKYIIDLNYGEITGAINKLNITKKKHSQQMTSHTGKPEIIIKGEYSDVKLIEK